MSGSLDFHLGTNLIRNQLHRYHATIPVRSDDVEHDQIGPELTSNLHSTTTV